MDFGSLIGVCMIMFQNSLVTEHLFDIDMTFELSPVSSSCVVECKISLQFLFPHRVCENLICNTQPSMGLLGFNRSY